MLRVLQFLFYGLIAFQSVAGVVPFRGDLAGSQQEAFYLIEEAVLRGNSEALVVARSLFIDAKQTEAVMPWALNTYASVLLMYDSVGKANQLLSDSSLVDWNKQDPWLQDYHRLNLAKLLGFQGNYSLAYQILAGAQPKSQSLLGLKFLQETAENLRYQGKLDQSLIKWYEALKVGEMLADSAEIAFNYCGRGIVRLLQDDLNKSEEDLKKYHEFNLKIGNERNVALALSILGIIRYKRKNYEGSIDLALESYDIRKALGDLKGQGESLNNLSLGYMGLKNWNQALRYLEQAVQLKAQANDHSQMTVILNNIGHCYMNLNQHEKALQYFESALAKGKENGQMGDVLNSIKNIVRLHTKQDDFEKAFRVQKRLIELKDSLSEAQKAEALRELEVSYETNRKEGEITLLQQKQTIITNRWLTLALALFLVIIIGLLIFDNQRRKHRQEKDLLSAEDELQKAELKIMTDLLEHNQQKLSLYTENLLRKNELVEHLEFRLKDVVEKSGAIGEEETKLVADFSSVRILTDDDWEEFKTLFDNVHQGLRERLKKNHGDLTVAEQRLFLLMKLDMSTKEIAKILGVSPESVKKARYRLKKKLVLVDDVLLGDFIKQF